MVFSVNSINESLNKKVTTFSDISEQYNDFSVFESTLYSMLEEQREFECNIIKINEGIIGYIGNKALESIKSIDVCGLLKKIFDLFIKAIKTLETILKNFLTSLLNKDKRLLVYKSKLDKYTGSVNYPSSYFIYTNLLNDKSYTNFEFEINKEYESLIGALSSLSQYSRSSDLANAISYTRNEIDSYPQYLDTLRGKILGRNRGISVDNYATELFKYFRNGNDTPNKSSLFGNTNIVDNNRFREAYEYYFNYKSYFAIVQRESNQLTKAASNQTNKVSKVKIQDYISIDISDQVITDYNFIITAKCRQINDICNIYRQYYASKIDAIKEYTALNMNILLEAIRNINKGVE